jgi:16S rRNA pseudouridine516 synthase
MQLQQILFSQGFGTRRICAGLVEQGHVTVGGAVCDDPDADFDVQGLRFTVQGVAWEYQERAYLLLHKPPGYECSTRPGAWPSVLSLLPGPLRQRPQKGGATGVQPVGRLDQDTTGLLLLSDDGAFIHRMTSPRHEVPKVYEVTTRDALDESVSRKLLAGVLLDGEREPVHAAACELTGPSQLRLTLTQGKYHQVKRMLAATGHHVVGLHRSRIGNLVLPPDLPRGQWRWMTPQDLAAAGAKS